MTNKWERGSPFLKPRVGLKLSILEPFHTIERGRIYAPYKEIHCVRRKIKLLKWLFQENPISIYHRLFQGQWLNYSTIFLKIINSYYFHSKVFLFLLHDCDWFIFIFLRLLIGLRYVNLVKRIVLFSWEE